ncbi:MAG: UPF0149 family protein [Sterolibacterium sp.]
MSDPQHARFTEADLDRLEELLDSAIFNDQAMQLDELQALICAVVSGPEVVPTSIWLTAALGESPAYASAEQANEVLTLVMSFYNDIAATLQQDEPWELILYPFADDPDELDFAAWADAYIYGTQLGNDWYEFAGDQAEDLSELLQSLFLLNGMLKEDAEKNQERWISAADEKLAISRAQEELPELVSAIYDFWRVRRSAGEGSAFSGGESPAGGSETCPCGSGKKYQQCCGSPAKLH